jgi:circadian clock protein KaiC
LLFHASRPSLQGLEAHLVTMHKLVTTFRPEVVVVDPLSSFMTAGTGREITAMVLRLVDFLKSEGITAFFTSLTASNGLVTAGSVEATEVGISSLIDTWLLLRDIELGGERNRGLYILKARGLAHSNQIREFLLTSHGIELQPVYVGPEGVLTGSMRRAQEAREVAGSVQRKEQRSSHQRELLRRRRTLEAQMEALRAEFEAIEEESGLTDAQEQRREQALEEARSEMARRRGGSGKSNGNS